MSSAQVPGLEPGKSRRHPLHHHFERGGGMVIKNRFLAITLPQSWTGATDAVVVSVEYRCPPEVQGARIVNDCYAGLCWVNEHIQELRVYPERTMVAGWSGGGSLAAGTALFARDRKGRKLRAQFLVCPILDDRNTTTSSKQCSSLGTWSRESNEMAWRAVLGGRAGKDGVDYYASPACAEELSGLLTTFIIVGSAEVFRDECISCATKLWAAGVQADLRVYGGGFHAFEAVAPHSRLTVQTDAARLDWVKGIFGPSKNEQQ